MNNFTVIAERQWGEAVGERGALAPRLTGSPTLPPSLPELALSPHSLGYRQKHQGIGGQALCHCMYCFIRSEGLMTVSRALHFPREVPGWGEARVYM
jgi:hypothetical protein